MKNIAHCHLIIAIFVLCLPARYTCAQIRNVSSLVKAVNNGSPNDAMAVGPGTFELFEPLRPKAGMTIRGAGVGKTIITAAKSWDPGTDGLPDGDVKPKQVNRNAYLIDLGDKTHNVTISHMTLTGPRHHGAVHGNDCDGLELSHLRVENFLWSSIRTFGMANARVHDNVFVNAGGKFRHCGGALFLTWVVDSEFWNNRITRNAGENFFGFKGRQAKGCRFHHNTVEVNFSLELPFENDANNEIDHNAFWGVISIPKHAGGLVLKDGHSFRIHHNWLRPSYALEWARNAAIVEYNLFDFDTAADGGNLISNFGKAPAPGPTHFRNNLIKNPGRGIFWSQGIYNRFYFENNHVITNTTTTPRKDGLFGLPSTTDFKTIVIRNNIIECKGLPRPLVRNDASLKAVIENNTLVNVSDSASYPNPDTGAKRGPAKPLVFTCGVNGEFAVNNWDVTRP